MLQTRILRLILSIMLVGTVVTVQGQTLKLVVNTHPSPYLSDWQSRRETAFMILTNTGGGVIRAKVKTELYNGKGDMIAATDVAKMPVLSIDPGPPATYYFEDIYPLSAVVYHGNFNTEQISRTGRLPDDNYRICVQLVDPVTGNGLTTQQCAFFSIIAYQQPTLVSPRNNETLVRDEVRRPMFQWTPVVPRPQEIVTYVLEIMEVMEGEEPGQAFRKHRPIVRKEIKGMTNTPWPIENQLPEPGRSYVWSVQSIDAQGRSIGENDGRAQYFSFNTTVSNQQGRMRQQQEPDGPHLIVGGVAQANFNGSLALSDTIHAGKLSEYAILVTTLTAQDGGQYKGEGTVYIPWLKATVAVEFNNIAVNNLKRLTVGQITAKHSNAVPMGLDWAAHWVGASTYGQAAVQWANNVVKDVTDWAKDLTHTKIPYLSATPYVPVLNMPFGLVESNNLSGYDTMAITEMIFKPNDAQVNIVLSATIHVNGLTQQLGFKASGISFRLPKIDFSSGKLELVEDVTIPNINNNMNNTVDLVFKKIAANPVRVGCYVNWNDNGIQKYGMDMDVIFPRNWLRPSPDNGTSKVAASFTAESDNPDDLLITGSLPKCEIINSSGNNHIKTGIIIDGGPGFVIDLSDTRNPAHIVFPPSYNYSPTVAWHGFYWSGLQVALPAIMKNQSNQPILVSLNRLIVDNTGLSVNAIVSNIITFPNASASGMSASVDTFKMEIVSSSLINSYLRGKIVLPICENTVNNAFSYKAILASANGFQFSISPKDSITAKFFGDATLTLDNTSAITMNYANNITTFGSVLNGEFNLRDRNVGLQNNGNPVGPQVKVKLGVKFQNMGLSFSSGTNVLTYDKGTWSFASPPKFMANFPVSIKDVKYTSKPKTAPEVLKGALSFAVSFNLHDNIGGNSALSLTGSVEKDPVTGKFRPKYLGVEIDTIRVFANLAAVKLDGKIAFFNGNAMLGNGFGGIVKVTLNSIKSEINANLIMGSTNYNANVNNWYRYWYTSASVILPKAAAIPFLTGVAFYGFGAGAWRGMTVGNIPTPNINAVAGAVTTTTSATVAGVTFTPDRNMGLGFKAMAVIGTYPEPKAFNCDAALSGEFTNSGGLNKINFNVDFWNMVELDQRANAKVSGNASIGYVPPDKFFYMDGHLRITEPSITTAGIGNPNDMVNMLLQIDGKLNKWYFVCGIAKPTGNVSNTNRVKVVGRTAWEYLMIGNNIGQFTYNNFQPTTIAGLNSVGFSHNVSTSIPAESSTGRGFAFGTGVSFNNSKTLNLTSRLHVNVGCNGGYEVNLSALQYPSNTSCGGYGPPIGFRTWYAQGGVAAWFSGSVTGHIDRKDGTIQNPCAFCCAGNHPNGCDYNFANLSLGLWVQAGFPCPAWVEGSGHVTVKILNFIDWNSNVDISYGARCTPSPVVMANSGFAQEDATLNVGEMVININGPVGTSRFDPGQGIGVMMGFKPDAAFDLPENQSNGTILNRTFQVRYFPALLTLGPAPMPVVNNNNIQQAPQNMNMNNDPPPLPPPTNVVRSVGTNWLGEYEYIIPRGGINYPFRNLNDTTNYRFTVRGELWTLNGNTWVPATRRNSNTPITETKTINFATGRLGPGVIVQVQNQQNNQGGQ